MVPIHIPSTIGWGVDGVQMGSAPYQMVDRIWVDTVFNVKYIYLT